jgi:GNAT superfamily N-acetyltransferase
VWNAALGAQFPLSARLFVQNAERDPHAGPERCWLAIVPGRRAPVGLCVAKVVAEPLAADGWLPERGWISLLAVHPAFQRRGIGAALLTRAEEYFRVQGRKLVTLGADPNHFLPGVPDGEAGTAFFRRLGYTFDADAYDLRRAVAGAPAAPQPAALAAGDAVIRPLDADDRASLLAFLDEVFPGRWRYGVDRFLRHGGAMQDIMGVVRPGQHRRVVGFAQLFHARSRYIGPSIAWSGRAGPRTGGIGPIGLAPDFRGRGLGLALLDRSVRRLASLGAEEVVVDWTSLLDFYGRLGFSVWRRYRQGAKRL